jgi:hypothetical protein
MVFAIGVDRIIIHVSWFKYFQDELGLENRDLTDGHE